MRVLYFGTYERHYPRNAQVISALRRAGVEVIERYEPVWEGTEHKLELSVASALRLGRAQLRLARRRDINFDVLVVGYPGHVDMLAARRAARGRPIVFNPLVSLEDTLIDDRQLVRRRSLRAFVVRMVDRKAFSGADLVVADTAEHGRFFSERMHVPPERISVCFVGADDTLFHPGEAPERPFEAVFVGKLIPLHGLDTILAAAAACPTIPFRLVGSGQLESQLSALPDNVRWDRWVDYTDLPALYRSAGCALGIFGTSGKAARVIPNKVFQALASGTAVVTADTPAARELLEHERDALLVPAGQPEALAAAVQRLAGDEDLRRRVADCGRRTYEEQASEAVLGRRWRSILESVVQSPAARRAH